MHTIMIDGSMYNTSREMHLALKKMLSLPDYYGLNADALNDCLSERCGTVNLWIIHPGNQEVSAALRLVSAVVRDNGGIVREIEVAG